MIKPPNKPTKKRPPLSLPGLPTRRTRDSLTSIRLTPREKATLQRYSIEHDVSESHVLRRGLRMVLEAEYPDFKMDSHR